MKDIEEIWYESWIHPKLYKRYSILKILDDVKQTINEWKGAELSYKSMEMLLHNVFKDVLNELNNALPTFIESVSWVSHLIP